MLVADAHEGLLRERRSQIGRHSLDDAACRSAKARISLVSGLGERCGRGLSQDGASTAGRVFIAALGHGELEEEIWIVVFREKSKEHSARVHQRRRITIPPVLEQAPYGADG